MVSALKGGGKGKKKRRGWSKNVKKKEALPGKRIKFEKKKKNKKKKKRTKRRDKNIT